MALRWLNDTSIAAAPAADAGLSAIQHFWIQIRFRGSYLLDMTRANTRTVRFGFYDSASPTTPTPSASEGRFEFLMRKRESPVDELEVQVHANTDASTTRPLGWGIPLTTVDALARDEWYTIYIQAFTDGTNQNWLYLYDDAGTALAEINTGDIAEVLPLGDHTFFVAGLNTSDLCEIDAFAIGSGTLAAGDRYVSPENHLDATRYWLFEDGSGSSVVEGSGGGQTLSITGTEGTDYEWFTGDWGDGGGPAPIEGSGSGTFDALTGTGAGVVDVTGTGAGALAALLGVGAGATLVAGTGAGSFAALTGSGVGTLADTLTLARFRWREDDGSEATATWREVEDANASAGVDETVRLRVQLQAGGVGGVTAAELRWRKKGTADPWEPVQ